MLKRKRDERMLLNAPSFFFSGNKPNAIQQIKLNSVEQECWITSWNDVTGKLRQPFPDLKIYESKLTIVNNCHWQCQKGLICIYYDSDHLI